MSWLARERRPEPELMDAGAAVEAYASAAAETHLRRLDQGFVDHVARLLGPAGNGAGLVALDIGCGPGAIPIMIARRWPALSIVAVDAAAPMIERARSDAEAAGVAVRFEVARLGPGGAGGLDFPAASFDLVTCNSVLHHLADPAGALAEIARVAKPAAAVLLRDLRRPGALAYRLHVRLFGRHYRGEMGRLFEASVGAAYTRPELDALLARSPLAGRSRVFGRGLSHIGIERPALERT